jgi:hypothetical protein
VAIVKYVLKILFNLSQYWYNSEAVTSLDISNEDAIIVTASEAPAKSLLRPLTE